MTHAPADSFSVFLSSFVVLLTLETQEFNTEQVVFRNSQAINNAPIFSSHCAKIRCHELLGAAILTRDMVENPRRTCPGGNVCLRSTC
jgi:hypothetical protein